MAKASPIQSSFNAGELSPQLRGRVDLEKYRNGCETIVNFLPQIYGTARKRPGTRFVKELKDSSKRSRLIPFEFSTTQAYILEFGDKYLRFFANGGVVVSSGIPYEIVTPYSDDEVADIDYAQSADVVYLAHPNHPPYKLSRFGPTNWTIAPVTFNWPPFNEENSTAVTLVASALTGNITLTASASFFTATDVGTYFKFEEILASKYDLWEPGKSITSGALRQYDGNLYQASSTATTGGRPPIHTEGTESDGGVNWVFLNDGAGYVEITSFTSATVVNATVIKRLPSIATSATTKWSEGAWSEKNGYPRTVTFYEDRLWFAGTKARPQTLYASTSGDYENHQYGTNDDDALNYTINTQDMNTIQWLAPTKVLAIGTSNEEFVLSATQISDPVTPTNVRITPQTTFGSAQGIRPLRIANAVLFLQRASRKLREYVYNFDTDSYTAQNLTLLSDHITGTGISDITYSQEPNQIVWAACSCGTLVGMTYERAEDVVGWHRHTLGGAVESVASIPHWDGDQDVLWLVVRRTIGGQTKRYIEYMEKYYTGDDSFYVDSGLSYSGPPVTTLSGLNHLEGKEVAIIIDGAVHPNLTVQSGAIQLQYPGSKISVGLPYAAQIKTMPFEAGATDGTAQGKTMRINNVVFRLLDTGPGLFYGPNFNNLDEYHPRKTTDLMDNPVPTFTGDTPLLPWPSGYETGAQVALEHRLALPCTLVAIMPQLHTYDR
jgi:hypothetical protein